jgi:hypothetical protein
MGSAIGGIAQGAGSVMAAQAQAGAMENQATLGLQGTREQIAEQGREFNTTTDYQKQLSDARAKAYQASLSTGGQQMSEGENALTTEANTANPELTQQTADIASGNAQQLQQGAAQMEANLAQQGVRGGQAAGLLNRASGEQAITAQKDVNTMKYTDAAQRAAELRAYQAAKAQKGQAATTPATGVSI